MVTEAVLVALVTVLGGILVELIRARRRQDTVVNAVTPNGGESLRDVVDAAAADIRELRQEQVRHGQRLAAVEAILSVRERRR